MVLCSLTSAVERRLTKASLAKGSVDWKQWALKSLEKGAAQAHKFCRSQDHVAIGPSFSGSLSRSQLATDASKHWEGVWHAHDGDRTARVVAAIAELRKKVLQSEVAYRTAQAITIKDLRAAAAAFPRRTAIGPDHPEFHVIAGLPEVILEPLLGIVRDMVCVISAGLRSCYTTGLRCLPRSTAGTGA